MNECWVQPEDIPSVNQKEKPEWKPETRMEFPEKSRQIMEKKSPKQNKSLVPTIFLFVFQLFQI